MDELKDKIKADVRFNVYMLLTYGLAVGVLYNYITDISSGKSMYLPVNGVVLLSVCIITMFSRRLLELRSGKVCNMTVAILLFASELVDLVSYTALLVPFTCFITGLMNGSDTTNPAGLVIAGLSGLCLVVLKHVAVTWISSD